MLLLVASVTYPSQIYTDAYAVAKVTVCWRLLLIELRHTLLTAITDLLHNVDQRDYEHYRIPAYRSMPYDRTFRGFSVRCDYV